MYKKFLSIGLLAIFAHVLYANEVERSKFDYSANIGESNELAVFTATESVSQEVKEDTTTQVVENQEITETQKIVETEETVKVEATTEAHEVIETMQTVKAEDITETHEVVETEQTVKAEEIKETQEVVETQEIKEEVISVKFDITITPRAQQILKVLSDEGWHDFEDFCHKFCNEFFELSIVQQIISKHSAIYDEYKKFKGDLARVVIDFFVEGDSEIDVIIAKANEFGVKFVKTLSEENKIKYEQAKPDITTLIDIAHDFVLVKSKKRKFISELVGIDTSSIFMFTVHID